MENAYCQPKTLIIAEVGINHNGSVELAKEMIVAAHEAGADFVKIQSFVMEEFFSPDLEYYEESASFSLSFEAQKSLFGMAREYGISLITTPFDARSLEFLDQFDLPAYKIASMDCDNYSLIRQIAGKGKKVFLSTGMATLGEVELAVKTILDTGNSDVHLLHCVSNYPTELKDVNLAFMKHLKEIFGLPVGLSDHTVGLESSLIAASLGASVIEKHFTTDKGLAEDFPGADHELSINAKELKQLRSFCDSIPVIMGDKSRPLSENEIAGRFGMRRAWYAKVDIVAGETLSLENLVALRPAAGVPASAEQLVMGARALRPISAGTTLQYGDFEV